MGRKKYRDTEELLDEAGLPTGNRHVKAIRPSDESNGSLFDLYEQEEGCPYCEYDGMLRSTRKGYRCPQCKEIVIPHETDEFG
jgi:hypothetical protein